MDEVERVTCRDHETFLEFWSGRIIVLSLIEMAQIMHSIVSTGCCNICKFLKLHGDPSVELVLRGGNRGKQNRRCFQVKQPWGPMTTGLQHVPCHQKFGKPSRSFTFFWAVRLPGFQDTNYFAGLRLPLQHDSKRCWRFANGGHFAGLMQSTAAMQRFGWRGKRNFLNEHECWTLFWGLFNQQNIDIYIIMESCIQKDSDSNASRCWYVCLAIKRTAQRVPPR